MGGGWICGRVVCSAGGMKERESLSLISETQQLFMCFLKCWQTGGSRAGCDCSSLCSGQNLAEALKVILFWLNCQFLCITVTGKHILVIILLFVRIKGLKIPIFMTPHECIHLGELYFIYHFHKGRR